ncbi:MAG: GNAT family N-acetyltransferase [Thermoplasmata archaeon]|nr:GNAT family N-acetyltransferase [Thermoplasmata archaeon]
MIRLELMTQRQLDESVERGIPRHAANAVRRGHWTEAQALEESRREFAARLPQGINTPGKSFCMVVEEEARVTVGETWFIVNEEGGKTHFWVDWLWIDLPHRRKGYASLVLAELAERARRLGADRIELSVYVDNPGAAALYAKIGYVPLDTHLVKLLTPST